MKEVNQEVLQKKYMEYQVLQQQIKQLQQQLQQFQQQEVELNGLSQSLDDFKKLEKGAETLVPISSGIFAKAKLSDNDCLLVNVGANTIVNKSVEDTKKLISRQSSEVKKIQEQVLAQLQKAAITAELREKELQSLVEEAQS